MKTDHPRFTEAVSIF